MNQIPNVNEQISILEQQLNILRNQRTFEQEQAARQAQAAQPPLQPQQIYANIPKKTAATEVLKHLTLSKWVGVASIVGLLIAAGASMFNKFALYGVALVMAVALGVYVAFVNKEIGRLKVEYGIK